MQGQAGTAPLCRWLAVCQVACNGSAVVHASGRVTLRNRCCRVWSGFL